MSDSGQNKTGPVKDDQLKQGMTGELRSGHSGRDEQWREAEPSGEDQPDVDLAPDGTLTGGTPPGMTADDVELRADLAQHLGRHVYPADRGDVLRTLRQNNAPDRLLDLVRTLPADDRYRNVQDIMRALGYGTEEHRT